MHNNCLYSGLSKGLVPGKYPGLGASSMIVVCFLFFAENVLAILHQSQMLQQGKTVAIPAFFMILLYSQGLL